MNLQRKYALVTGGAKRVGAAIVRALAQEDVSVAVHYHHSKQQAETLCQELVQGSIDAFAVQADLREPAQIRTLMDQVRARWGKLDLLVSSAADFGRVPVHEVTDEVWERTLALNVRAPWLLAQAAESMLRKNAGNIVFITCTSATRPFRNYLPYVVSKGALRQLMRVLALEYAPQIRVNAVAPGTVLPPENMDPKVLQRIVSRIPLGAEGSAEDIAQAVLFLAHSEFVTGAEISVDGGASVSP